MSEYREFQERSEKAYNDLEFLGKRSARPIRILAEYMQPEHEFKKSKVHNTVIFFGSARILSPERYQRTLQELKADLDDSSNAERRRIQREMNELRRAHRYVRYYDEARELARLVTEWSMNFNPGKRFLVCSGGGPGIMEAANRGVCDAGGDSIGLNISLPFEQYPNGYITKHLNFEFHYFFMRKYWFMYFAKALVVFPGGFGTLDELFELLTLVQTGKIHKPLHIILYGKNFWRKIVNFEAMAEAGMIAQSDLKLFRYASKPQEAFEILRTGLLSDSYEVREYHSFE